MSQSLQRRNFWKKVVSHFNVHAVLGMRTISRCFLSALDALGILHNVQNNLMLMFANFLNFKNCHLYWKPENQSKRYFSCDKVCFTFLNLAYANILNRQLVIRKSLFYTEKFVQILFPKFREICLYVFSAEAPLPNLHQPKLFGSTVPLRCQKEIWSQS